MELSEHEFNSIKSPFNYVVTKSIRRMDKVHLGGQKIFLDTSYAPENHQEVIHEVIQVPDRLIYSRKDTMPRSMQWDTDMELQVGDIVWVNYLAVIKAHRFTYNGETYYFFPYWRIYLTIRPWDYQKDKRSLLLDYKSLMGLSISPDQIIKNWQQNKVLYLNLDEGQPPEIVTHNERKARLPDNLLIQQRKSGKITILSYFKVVMLNGYVLYERPKVSKHKFFWAPGKKADGIGIIRYMGKPNRQYREPIYHDDDYVRIGDQVHLAFNFGKKLENPIHAEFDNGKVYYVTQRRYMRGIFK